MTQHNVTILSDLHIDQWVARTQESHAVSAVIKTLPEPFLSPDLVISAGDLAHARPFGWSHGIREVKSAFPGNTKYLFFPGNHDYYLRELDDADLKAECDLRKIIFGQKSETHLGATRILTCTLWSDGLLFGEKHFVETMRIVEKSLNDYNLISKPRTGSVAQDDTLDRAIHPKRITGQDTLDLHADHKAWLESRLAIKHDGPTMIVTHHGPHPEASLPCDAISAGFVSDLSDIIEAYQPDAWVFGHTHRPQSAQLGKTRIHNVGLGYPHEAAEYGPEELMLRGCVEVGDEIRFAMDTLDPRPIHYISMKEKANDQICPD